MALAVTFGGAAVVGCGGGRGGRSAAVAPASAGAASAAGAVEQFLAAARANDARRMGLLFGTRAGPITARESASDVEKRMLALACYLATDSAQIVGDVPALSAGREVTAELRQRELTRRTRFTVVTGPANRWFVSAFDIDAVSDLCRPR